MPKKDSKNQKKSIGIKETLAGADTSLMEKQLKEQIEAPMVRLSYTYAMDVVQAKLKMINADLTEQFDRQVIRSMTGRIKQTDSIAKRKRSNISGSSDHFKRYRRHPCCLFFL